MTTNNASMTTKAPILGGRERVKIAIAQVSPAFLDPEATAARAEAAIREAAGEGAELVVFPEVWLAGYPYWTEGWDSDVGRWAGGRVRWSDAAVVIGGEHTERIAAAARASGVYVAIGMNELDPRPGCHTIYNTLLFLDREGQEVGRHRKLMPTFSERIFWGNGDGRDLFAFDTDIGRIGGLICGENAMPLVRCAMISQGEDIHIAVFPGSFAVHTGPQLEEPDQGEFFWGHAACRAHSMEAGAFVVAACGYLDPADVPEDFPHREGMNTGYAHGGSAVFGGLGIPLVAPAFGPQIIYAELEAAMIKVVKSIIDTNGHYARPDVLQLLVRRDRGWEPADVPAPANRAELRVDRDALRRSAERHDVDETLVEQAVEPSTS